MNIREDFLPLSKPAIGPEEIEAVTRCLLSGWITTGPVCQAFEKALCELTAASNAVSFTVTIRQTPTASISGGATVCPGSASPDITFTNPLNLPVTITYVINGGSNLTINVPSNSTATVAEQVIERISKPGRLALFLA